MQPINLVGNYRPSPFLSSPRRSPSLPSFYLRFPLLLVFPLLHDYFSALSTSLLIKHPQHRCFIRKQKSDAQPFSSYEECSCCLPNRFPLPPLHPRGLCLTVPQLRHMTKAGSRPGCQTGWWRLPTSSSTGCATWHLLLQPHWPSTSCTGAPAASLLCPAPPGLRHALLPTLLERN